ncbi:uncharacterized protein RCC_08633 [Ramularia collo-cygni]|uniref:PAC domain-containing protein n=1 Tax=Ramularia collo-cygni TaxID=112498 RepID=A0A2D3VB90_9PEZI|nr:uncharacterized protein RCC_08633 [Ramularia collo-cygni]CZT22925.1 uncharacterized protein RCC_08633 [Ramularia collo-cygni]
MSNLRVINVSPREEEAPYFASVHANYDDADDVLDDSPMSTPGGATRAPLYTREEMPSPVASPAPASVFGASVNDQEYHDQASASSARPVAGDQNEEDDSELDSFNLQAPPPPTGRVTSSLEALTARFFSADHLDMILRDQSLAMRFSGFLGTYLPQHVGTLNQYKEAKKIMLALDYANAAANQMSLKYGHPIENAATLDRHFGARKNELAHELVHDALPAYLTHQLVSLVTDTLVKEITGHSAPVMRDLVPSLAEVYCISDPSLPDNPIVYASEEFYNTSMYSREQVIGRNCRFLQGPKTSSASIRRLVAALTQGEECCETVLNYKRDGTPFMNLLLIAPLYDNKGKARYFLGCQIDVSSLIEGGKGIESFAQLLFEDRLRDSYSANPVRRDPKETLREFGQLLSPEESDSISNRMRPASVAASGSLASGIPIRTKSRGSRIILGMDAPDPRPPQMWPHASLGPSGRLPGVYQNYLLVRPYPSLRITFTSPTLRIPGMLQSKLLDRIGGPEAVRTGLLEALMNGTGVTAKIAWLTSGSDMLEHGKVRWIHCTPLLGSDEKVGVWMVVMVENELVTGGLNRHSQVITPGVDSVQGAQRYTGAKLYADYLRREGRPGTGQTLPSSSSTREMRTVDEVFRDF